MCINKFYTNCIYIEQFKNMQILSGISTAYKPNQLLESLQT